MKSSHVILIACLFVGVLASTSCKTTYIDRTVYVQPTPTPRVHVHHPRLNDPDNFDAVGKPTSYSHY